MASFVDDSDDSASVISHLTSTFEHEAAFIIQRTFRDYRSRAEIEPCQMINLRAELAMQALELRSNRALIAALIDDLTKQSQAISAKLAPNPTLVLLPDGAPPNAHASGSNGTTSLKKRSHRKRLITVFIGAFMLLSLLAAYSVDVPPPPSLPPPPPPPDLLGAFFDGAVDGAASGAAAGVGVGLLFPMTMVVEAAFGALVGGVLGGVSAGVAAYRGL